MGIFKIWGAENIVRDVEDYGGTTEYLHVESIVGEDEISITDLTRPARNLFENEQILYNYLDAAGKNGENVNGIFKESLDHAFKITSGTDFLTLAIDGAFETTTILVNSDNASGQLDGQYFFMYASNGTQYYFWYDNDDVGTGDPSGGSDIGGATGVAISVATDDNIDTVIYQTILAIIGTTVFSASANYVTDTITATATSHGNLIDSEDGADDPTGFIVTPIDGSAIYKNYVRIPPGVGYVNNTIFVNRPQIHIAERQLENILGLRTDETIPEYVTITYDFTNDKYQARIYKKDNTGVITYSEFVNGGTWGTITDGYDTGIELILAIFQNTLFTESLNNALGGYNFERILLEPTIVISETGAGVVRYIYIDGATLDFAFDTPIGGATDLNLFTVDFDADASSITINTLTDTRTFFQHDNDYFQNVYLNVPREISGEVGNVGTEDVSNIDYDKVTNQDASIVVLRDDGGGGPDNSYIMWDHSESHFSSNRDMFLGENLTAETRGNNPILLTNAVNENIDVIDAAIGSTISPVARTNNPTIDANTINANLSALDAAIGVTVIPVARTNNPTLTTNSVDLNIDALDAAVGVTVTPQSRTNNPTLISNSVNINVDTLDAAIGTDVTPQTRTLGQLVVDTSVNAKIDVLDMVIGIDVGPVSRTFANLSNSNSINVNISTLDDAIGGDPGSVNHISASDSINANLGALDSTIGGDVSSGNDLVAGAAIHTNLQHLQDGLDDITVERVGRDATNTIVPTGEHTGYLAFNDVRDDDKAAFYGGTSNPNLTSRLNYNGNFYANAFYATSNRANKTNIIDFKESALDIINETSIKSFNYKTNLEEIKIGFIAEDTNPILSTEKQTNFDIMNTVSVLIKAVQELSEEIKVLKGAIA